MCQKVLAYITHGAEVLEQNGAVLTKEQQASSMQRAMELGLDGVLKILWLMREQRTVGAA